MFLPSTTVVSGRLTLGGGCGHAPSHGTFDYSRGVLEHEGHDTTDLGQIRPIAVMALLPSPRLVWSCWRWVRAGCADSACASVKSNCIFRRGRGLLTGMPLPPVFGITCTSELALFMSISDPRGFDTELTGGFVSVIWVEDDELEPYALYDRWFSNGFLWFPFSSGGIIRFESGSDKVHQ